MGRRGAWSPAGLAEYGAVAGLGWLFDWLPEGAAYALGEGAGRVAHRLDGRHRGIARENLRQAFPAMEREKVEALARAVFVHLGRTVVDAARAGRLLRPGAGGRVAVEGLERLRAARDRGRGVLIISAHLGPWELIPQVAPLVYEPIHVVARPLDNPRLDRLLTRIRERSGSQVIQKRDALRAVLGVLRAGGTAAMLIDQHISEREGAVVPFFGRPASTVTAPALIAIRSGAAVLPSGIVRDPGRGRYRILIGEEVPLARSGDLKADLVENTARFMEALEGMIRAWPEQWFWVHRRWKTTQPLDPRLGGTWKT